MCDREIERKRVSFFMFCIALLYCLPIKAARPHEGFPIKLKYQECLHKCIRTLGSRCLYSYIEKSYKL